MSQTITTRRLITVLGRAATLLVTLSIKEKTKFQAANHSVRRHGQTDRLTNKHRPLNFFIICGLLVTLGQSKDCYESPSGSFNCPRLFDSGGKPLSPLPRTPIHKRKDQLPGSQSQRAQTRTDKQTNRYTNKLRLLNFFIICGC